VKNLSRTVSNNEKQIKMLEIALFRCNFIKPAQLDILIESDSEYSSSTSIFINALKEAGPNSLLDRSNWIFASLRSANDFSFGSFVLGKQSLGFVDRFSPELNSFFEEEMILGPNTIIYFHTGLGLLGILKKPKLSPNSESIAKRLQKLFLGLGFISRARIDVIIDPIRDSKEFLEIIDQAYAVTSFKYGFVGPNPFDADEYFHKPLSNYAQQIAARRGNITVSGEALDSTIIRDITSSVAASGQDISAKVKMENDGAIQKISVKKGPITISVDANNSVEEIIYIITSEYDKIRQK
jgi:hypothetical protein